MIVVYQGSGLSLKTKQSGNSAWKTGYLDLEQINHRECIKTTRLQSLVPNHKVQPFDFVALTIN